MNRKLNFLHVIPVHRSAEGAVFGVFRGFAEHARFSVAWTRVLGVLVLLGVGDTGEHLGISLPFSAVGAYVLLALLMQPPAATTAQFANGYEGNSGGSRLRPVFSATATTPTRDSVDFPALERRLDSLARRIAKMENVVVTRERDWDRRLGT